MLFIKYSGSRKRKRPFSWVECSFVAFDKKHLRYIAPKNKVEYDITSDKTHDGK